MRAPDWGLLGALGGLLGGIGVLGGTGNGEGSQQSLSISSSTRDPELLGTCYWCYWESLVLLEGYWSYWECSQCPPELPEGDVGLNSLRISSSTPDSQLLGLLESLGALLVLLGSYWSYWDTASALQSSLKESLALSPSGSPAAPQP